MRTAHDYRAHLVPVRWTMAPMVDDPEHMYDLFRDGDLMVSGLTFNCAEECCEAGNRTP